LQVLFAEGYHVDLYVSEGRKAPTGAGKSAAVAAGRQR
jgi:hypothetical protein